MRRISLKTWALTLSVATLGGAAAATTRTMATDTTQTPAPQALQSIGPLAFGPDGVLFAADPSGRDHLRDRPRREGDSAAHPGQKM